MAGKKRLKGWKERTEKQARKDSFKGSQENAQRQPRQVSKAGKERLKGRQERNQRQASKNSKACKKRLKGREYTTRDLNAGKKEKSQWQARKKRL